MSISQTDRQTYQKCHTIYLGQEVLQAHGLLLQRLHGHNLIVAQPNALVHIAILPGAELGPHLDLTPVQLPLVATVMQHVRRTEREANNLNGDLFSFFCSMRVFFSELIVLILQVFDFSAPIYLI